MSWLCRLSIIMVVPAFVGFMFSPVAFGDEASEFAAAWNQRRTVAPYVRCRTETVRVIRANSLGEDFNFPAKETIVDEEQEFLIDTALRRIRTESKYFICVHGKSLQKRHAVTLFTSERIVSYTLSLDGKNPAMSMATIRETPYQNHARSLDALFRFQPSMWALGYLNAADIDRPGYDGSFLVFSKPGENRFIVSPIWTPFLQYDVDPEKDFALIRCVLYSRNSTTFDAGQAELSIDVTWQQLPEGWFPQSWQLDVSSEKKSTKVVKWEFLDHVAEALWEEPKGVRER